MGVIYWIKISLISYTTSDGEEVTVEYQINPFEILNITTSASWDEIRNKFRTLINDSSRQKRVLVSLAYPIVGAFALKSSLPDYFQKLNEKTFTCNRDHPIIMALTGQCEALRKLIEKNRSICDVKSPLNESLLYLAVRSGYLDVVEMLCMNGVDINAIENESTALHAAAYYNHENLVSFLIRSGASINRRNKYGNLPIDEASTNSMKQLIVNSQNDPLIKLLQDVLELSITLKLEHIYDGNEMVAFRIMRKVENRKDIAGNWVRGYHGTPPENVVSIFRNGLLRPGDMADGKIIEVRDNHWDPDTECAGIKRWGRAVFLSTSIFYASCACYAVYIQSPESGRWCLLIEVGAKPETYTIFTSTIGAYEAVPGDLKEVEVRVETGREIIVNDSSGNPILAKVNENINAVVLALLLVKESYLKKAKEKCFKISNDPTGEKMKSAAREAKVILSGTNEPRSDPNSIPPQKNKK